MSALLQAALHYAELGYPVFPCARGGKAPLTPHGFQDATTDAAQIEAWWTQHPSANIGMPTAGLLVIDVDGADNPWPGDPEKELDLERAPTSLTPRGGRHHIFRQPAGKAWGNTAGKIVPKVDTRANGGYIVVPPSVVGGKPYHWGETLELDAIPETLPEPPSWLAALVDGVGDLFATGAPGGNGNGNGAPLGAHRAPQGDDPPADGKRDSGRPTERYPGAPGGCHAPVRYGQGRDPGRPGLGRMKSGASRRFSPGRSSGWRPASAGTSPTRSRWPWPRTTGPRTRPAPHRPASGAPTVPDPGPLPDELFRVPGFVSEVMDHCLATAPYPNVVMAFAGALALQATLAGRKVRDPDDNRTNLYLLGLAHSSAGKDRPRKLNTEILHAVGLSSQVGGRFASGEGVQDALFVEPCMLFQTDEIDGMLQSINKARDARHESIMGTLLTMFSSANSVFPMRRKAGREAPGAINQPCLVVFGTAIPNHYYEALSERMLTNGFFARTVVLECGKRSTGQAPGIRTVPVRILQTAQWWADFRPGTGNLQNLAPRAADHPPDRGGEDDPGRGSA